MEDLNIEKMKENIKKLMRTKEPKVTQEQLAQIAGMEQPQVCKALSAKNSNFFTIEQLVKISEFFHVTIDCLIGNTGINNDYENYENLTVKELCKIINGIANIRFVKIADVENTAYHNMFGINEDYQKTYKSIYFDNLLYDVPETYNPANVQINKFINKMCNLLSLKEKNELSKEDYDYLIKKHLDNVSDKLIADCILNAQINELPFN